MQEKDLTGAVNSAASESKIDKETAEKEFDMFCKNNSIENNTADMNEDEKYSFEEIKKRFVKACMAGRVEVDGRSIKYTISNFSPEGFKGEIVTIKRPTGQSFSAMDDFKDNQGQKKTMAFVSAMTGKEVRYFNKIDYTDYRFFADASTLFLS